MSCLYPILLRRKASGSLVRVPCGKCDACLRRRSNEWGLRCVHELHSRPAIFVTLTYRDPAPASLQVPDLQKYFKRLRKRYDISYLAAGEYGKLKGRAHYHLILYYKAENFDKFKIFVRNSWPFGNVHIGTVSMRSAVYVAKYTSKDFGRQYYIAQSKHPPYICASRGLGLEYARKFIKSWCAHGGINLEGYTYPIPRYYRKQLLTTWESIEYNITQLRRNFGKEEDYADLSRSFEQRQLTAETLRGIKRGNY